MGATVTNSAVDTLAAAVPSGSYGPWTRVTDVEARPAPQSERVHIEFTTANNRTVYATYIQLQNADVVERLGKQAEARTDTVQRIKTTVDALDTTMAGYSAPHTYAEYKTTVRTLRGIKAIDRA